MAYTLSFLTKHSYDTTKTGITVPVELAYGTNVVQVDAKLDTGASFCIFERAYAEMLGLDVESGTKMLVSTANSTFECFGHWLRMTAIAFQFDAIVYFAADKNIRRSVLGRRGFIDQLRLCIIEHDGELYGSKFDDE
ncbi:MAG TPA: aspartyl protease family protein [Blastocatellia bacterium]|nr:aspartyl protease family protein [Blastocatellia bacterium]